jgi:hypothetical protein
MCSVEQMSRPIVSPCSLPMTMSSRQQRTSCSRVRKTSGPMKPATSLTCTHGAGRRPPRPLRLADPRPAPGRSRTCATRASPCRALAVAVGEVGPLPGLEVEPVAARPRAAYASIFSVLMSKVRLAASLPARLWNHRAVRPGCRRSTSACTSMWASTQWGRTSSRPNVTIRSCSAASTAATDSGVLETGLVPSSTSPTANDQPERTCQRMSSTSSVGEFGWIRAPR